MSVELGRQKSIYTFLWGNVLGTEKTIHCGRMKRKKLVHDEVQYNTVVSALLNFATVRHNVRLYRQMFVGSVKCSSFAWLPIHQAIQKQNLLSHSSRSYAWNVNVLYSMTH